MSLLDVMEDARSLLNQYPRYLHLAASKAGPRGEIVEIAVVDSNGTPILDALVQPRGAIRPQFSQVHGITNERVRAAPTWPETWPQVRAALAGQTVLCYHLTDCLNLLRQSHQAYRLRWDMEQLNMIGIQPIFTRYRQQVDPRAHTHTAYSLEEAAQMLGLSSEAIYYRRTAEDAALLRLILQRLANPAGRLYTE